MRALPKRSKRREPLRVETSACSHNMIDDARKQTIPGRSLNLFGHIGNSLVDATGNGGPTPDVHANAYHHLSGAGRLRELDQDARQLAPFHQHVVWPFQFQVGQAVFQ